MHKAGAFLAGLYPSKGHHVGLSLAQSRNLRSALAEDASGLHYSGIVTFGQAINSLQLRGQSWACVKLYYSLFYALRSILASEKISVFYIGKTPFSIRADPGCIPIKRKGTTHVAVFDVFRSCLPNSPLLSQPIGMANSLEWLMALRERANYSSCRFLDPSWHEPFRAVKNTELRKLLSAYANDRTMMYVFDEDHATIALPFEALRISMNLISNFALASEEASFVRRFWSDQRGEFFESLSQCGI